MSTRGRICYALFVVYIYSPERVSDDDEPVEVHAGQVPDHERLQQGREEALEQAGWALTVFPVDQLAQRRRRVHDLDRRRGGAEKGRRREGEEEQGEGGVESAEVEQEYRVRL